MAGPASPTINVYPLRLVKQGPHLHCADISTPSVRAALAEDVAKANSSGTSLTVLHDLILCP